MGLATSHTDNAADSINAPAAEKNYFLTVDEVLALPSPQWLVRDLIPLGGVGVLYGSSGSLKSFFALHLAACCAVGQDAFTGKQCRQASAFYIAAEGASGFKLRMDAWIRHHKAKPERLYLRPCSVYINEKTEIDTFIDEVNKVTGAVEQCFIVIDTLSANFTGNENTDDMAQFLRRCAEISRATGATILVVHHTGKDERREERGHYSLRANADFSIRVDRTEEGATVQVQKFKDAAAGRPLELKTISVEVAPGAEFSTSYVLEEIIGFEDEDKEDTFDEMAYAVLYRSRQHFLLKPGTQKTLVSILGNVYAWKSSKAVRAIQSTLPEGQEVEYDGTIICRTGTSKKGQKIITVKWKPDIAPGIV